MTIHNPASVWRLEVELLGVAPTVWRRFDTYADVRLSQLHYASPPEDCGGSWGYMDMLMVLAGRRNARRRELVEWLGGSLDPKAFDIDEAMERLAEYVKVSMPKAQPV